MKVLVYNSPTQTLRCITSVESFKFAKFELTDSNVRKRPFPFSRPYKWFLRPPDSIDVLTRPAHEGGLVGCKSLN